MFASQVKLPGPLDAVWGIELNWSEADATISKPDGIHMSLVVASPFKDKLDAAGLELQIDELFRAQLAAAAANPCTEGTEAPAAGGPGVMPLAMAFETPAKGALLKRSAGAAGLKEGGSSEAGGGASRDAKSRGSPPAGHGGKRAAPPPA